MGDGGLAVDDLRTCLTDAGLDPRDGEAKPIGVEDPFELLEVTLDPEGTDSDLVAELYVFASEDAAETNRTAITLQTEDDDRNRVAGNVLLRYTIIPSYDPDGAAAVEGCLG